MSDSITFWDDDLNEELLEISGPPGFPVDVEQELRDLKADHPGLLHVRIVRESFVTV